jgi:hypothetical protein
LTTGWPVSHGFLLAVFRQVADFVIRCRRSPGQLADSWLTCAAPKATPRIDLTWYLRDIMNVCYLDARSVRLASDDWP